MPQFQNEQHFSEDTFGAPHDCPTPISNTFTFNPAQFTPPSPLSLPSFTPRRRISRWDDGYKLFDPNILPSLQENIEFELENMPIKHQISQKIQFEPQLPFIIEPLPKSKKCKNKSSKTKRQKKEQNKKKQIQTNLETYLKKRKVIQK